MIIIRDEREPGRCDICHARPATRAGVAQGATGRWCEVIWGCVECLPTDDLLTVEQARERIEGNGNGYADF